MAFSLACANLVCSIKEFIPWLGKKETGNQKDLVQMNYISECSPQKCFQVHGNTFWWFEFAHPAHTLVMTHSSLILARELRYLLSMHASKKKFIFGMKLYLVVLNCVFRKKNILVWNTSILPLDFQSTVPIGLWKDSNFSPILSASWIVFY